MKLKLSNDLIFLVAFAVFSVIYMTCNGCTNTEAMQWELEYKRAVVTSLKLYAGMKRQVDSLETEIDKCKNSQFLKVNR